MSDRPAPWTVLSRSYLLERWWMKLRVDEVRLPDGQVLPEYHVLEYPDWTLSMCQDVTGKLILVEQYRHGTGKLSLEFASGMLDEDELPLEGACRELLEETGHVSESWIRLGRWAPDPSRHDNVGHVFLARHARSVAPPSPDSTEDLRVISLSVREVDAAIRDGRITHGLHVAAFYRAATDGLLEG
ncbi:MAG: NUDIX hydrolase [Rhodothermales bacterium]